MQRLQESDVQLSRGVFSDPHLLHMSGVLEMLAGLKEKAVSVHVAILGDQDSRAREALELREE